MTQSRFAKVLPGILLTGALGCVTGHAVAATEETPFAIPGGTYVTTAEAKALFDNGATFVDTRGKAEYIERHVKGARHIQYKEKDPATMKLGKSDPADTFDLSKLPAEKATELVFYCNGSPCWKGYKGAIRAIETGYTHVHWYRDGMLGWGQALYPVE